MRKLALLLAFALAIAAHAADLKVMTYNVHNGVGLDKVRDHARIGELIKAQKPDVVAIQEVDSLTNRSGRLLVLNEIAEAAGMTPIFAPAIDFDGGKYGIGLLVSEQPLQVRAIPLPGREEARVMIMAEFESYVAVCTHFSLTPADALASAKIVKSLLSGMQKPVILMGDLNSNPGDDAMQELATDFVSANPGGAPTFPANNPQICIDHILISRSTPVEIISVEILPEPLASDHRPIAATLRL